MTLAFSNDNPNKDPSVTDFTYTPTSTPIYDISIDKSPYNIPDANQTESSNIVRINRTNNITYISSNINIERNGEDSPKSVTKSPSKHSRNLSKEDFMTEGFIAKHQQRYSLSNPQDIIKNLNLLDENTSDDTDSYEEHEILEIKKQKKKLSALKQASESIDEVNNSDTNDIQNDSSNQLTVDKQELFRHKSSAKWSSDDIKKQHNLMAQEILKLHNDSVSHEYKQMGKQLNILTNNNQ